MNTSSRRSQVGPRRSVIALCSRRRRTRSWRWMGPPRSHMSTRRSRRRSDTPLTSSSASRWRSSSPGASPSVTSRIGTPSLPTQARDRWASGSICQDVARMAASFRSRSACRRSRPRTACRSSRPWSTSRRARRLRRSSSRHRSSSQSDASPAGSPMISTTCSSPSSAMPNCCLRTSHRIGIQGWTSRPRGRASTGSATRPNGRPP